MHWTLDVLVRTRNKKDMEGFKQLFGPLFFLNMWTHVILMVTLADLLAWKFLVIQFGRFLSSGK